MRLRGVRCGVGWLLQHRRRPRRRPTAARIGGVACLAAGGGRAAYVVCVTGLATSGAALSVVPLLPAMRRLKAELAQLGRHRLPALVSEVHLLPHLEWGLRGVRHRRARHLRCRLR